MFDVAKVSIAGADYPFGYSGYGLPVSEVGKPIGKSIRSFDEVFHWVSVSFEIHLSMSENFFESGVIEYQAGA